LYHNFCPLISHFEEGIDLYNPVTIQFSKPKESALSNNLNKDDVSIDWLSERFYYCRPYFLDHEFLSKQGNEKQGNQGRILVVQFGLLREFYQ
jgi:hypothetical protein